MIWQDMQELKRLCKKCLDTDRSGDPATHVTACHPPPHRAVVEHLVRQASIRAWAGRCQACRRAEPPS